MAHEIGVPLPPLVGRPGASGELEKQQPLCDSHSTTFFKVVYNPQRVAEVSPECRLMVNGRVSLEHTPLDYLMSASPITPYVDGHRGSSSALCIGASNLDAMSW